MDWKDRLELLRWRAVEEADAQGALLPFSERTEATRHAEAGDQFLKQRTAWLAQHAGRAVRSVIDSMHVPSLHIWSWIGWLIALLAGYAFAELGANPHDATVNDASLQGRLINVLALPLMSILLWNAAMILASLVMEWKSSATSVGLPKLVRNLVLRRAGDSIELNSKVIERFHARVDPLLGARFTSQARAWLHVGAAMLALGAIIGMYAKGWSREYRVVWESTLLDQPTASRLLSALYKPASAIFGVEVPLHQLESMRAGPGRMPEPQNALPWIHLYAGTLFLLVILPRLALASLTRWRGSLRVELAWAKFDWAMHEARLKATISGTGLTVDVLSLGWRVGEEPRERWSATLREHFGALALLQFHALSSSDNEEFARHWQSHATTTVIVFNAATTPEIEVHTSLARELRERVHAQGDSNRLLALLDAQSLTDRRAPEAVKTRLDLWQQLLSGTVDETLTCGVPRE
jgi:hypothetical protein